MNRNINPKEMLLNIARGSFGGVIERNNKLILIKTNTEKVKNRILREFVKEAVKEGYTYEDLVEVLLELDDAVERNEVRKTLKDYLS